MRKKIQWKITVLIIILVYFSSCVSFRRYENVSFKGYKNDGSLSSRIISDLNEQYLHENRDSKSGIFYIPIKDCDITSVCSENDFYKVIEIDIFEFPDFIVLGDNYFKIEITLSNGRGELVKLRNEYNFSCSGKENYYFDKYGFWEHFLSTNNIEIIHKYSNSIASLEKGKIYNFESIYVFKFFQQIRKNQELLHSVNKYFTDDIEWETTNLNNIELFPIFNEPRDSWGYYYYIFTTYSFPYHLYKIVAGKDPDTYLIITHQGEPVAVIQDKNKAIKYKNTEQYYSFQDGSYEIDYYQFIENKSIVCRYTKNTMPIRLTSGKTINKRVYETHIMNNSSPLYWTDGDSYQKIWHIIWDDSKWVSYYKYQNNIYNYRAWEEYIIMDKNGIPHKNLLTFYFNPLTAEDVLRNWR